MGDRATSWAWAQWAQSLLASRRVMTGLALALGAAHFASFDLFSQPIITDVRYFLYYAWRVAEWQRVAEELLYAGATEESWTHAGGYVFPREESQQVRETGCWMTMCLRASSDRH